MKKVLLLIITCLMAISMQAQEEHMKFMGIPLNGSITQFHSKLVAKGLKYDAEASKRIVAGCRKYEGVFSNEKAEIYVYYNEKTKVVYRAKAVIEYMNKEKGETKLKDFEYSLKNKYPNAFITHDEYEGHPSITVVVDNSKKDALLGYIGLYITNPPYSFMDQVYLHIDYEDSTNKRKNEQTNLDDL